MPAEQQLTDGMWPYDNVAPSQSSTTACQPTAHSLLSQLLRLQVAVAVQRALALAAARREGRSPIEEDASPPGPPHGASDVARAPRLPSMCASVAGRLLLCMERL